MELVNRKIRSSKVAGIVVLFCCYIDILFFKENDYFIVLGGVAMVIATILRFRENSPSENRNLIKILITAGISIVIIFIYFLMRFH